MENLMQNGVNLKENSFHDGIVQKDKKHFTPTTIEEIKSILGQAQIQRSSVQVIQSPNHNITLPLISSSSNVFIDLKSFNKIIEIDVSKKLITVEGGTSLSTISNYLEKVGLALPIPILPTDLTIAYALNTAAHVSNIRSGILSSYVHQLELLTSDAQILICSQHSKPEILKAAACGLGICGIILSVTLQCKPLHNVEHLQTGCSFLKIIDKLNICLQKQNSFRMLWFPHTDNAVIFSSKETKKSITAPNVFRQRFDRYTDVSVEFCLQFFYCICLFLPFLLPLAHHIIYWLGFGWRRTSVSTASHSFKYQPPGSYQITEWAIPLNRATEALLKLYDWSNEGVHFLHFPVDIQFIKKDELYLSPACDTDVCCISLTIMRPFNIYFPYEQAFVEFAEMMKSVGGRPCWGKGSSTPKVKENELKDMFQNFETWKEIREDLDPYDLFSNNFFLDDI